MPTSRDGDIFGAAAGAGLTPEEILDFSGNVNPCPAPDGLREAIQDPVNCLQRYPDPQARKLRERAAEAFGLSADEIAVGNGIAEFLYAIPRGLRPRRAVILAPCSHDYWSACDAAGAESEGVLSAESHEFIPDMGQLEMRLSGTDMVFLGNPNNPTGVSVPADSIRALAAKCPSVVFVVDESFGDFVSEAMAVSLSSERRPENVIVLRSPALFFGLPGLRLGFMLASREMIGRVERAREPWTVGSLSLCAGEALLSVARDAPAMREPVIAERERVRDELSGTTGLRVFRSQANFLLLKITRPGLTSAQICERMLKQKILIRNAAGFRGLDGRFLRVSVRTAPDNDQLLAALRNALDEPRWR